MSRRSTRSGAFDVSSMGGGMPSTTSGIAQSTVMYINSQFNHPAFSKLYLGPNLSHNGKSYGGSGAVPKPPKAPEKPLMPYMRYSKKVWDEVKANQPDRKLWEIGKVIGKMWRELPSGDKQPFMDEYEADKVDYQEHMKNYHNSSAYQGYLQAKGRAEAEASVESRAVDQEISNMSIETADDGSNDTDEGFSVKHVAAARFRRNHRLMQDILSDSAITPSGRGIVNEQRLNVLKHQVQSLERHQTKLQNELMEIEKRHDATKRKWKEQSGAFSSEAKRLRQMTPQEYYAEYKKKQQEKAAAKESKEEAKKAKESESKEPEKAVNDEASSITDVEPMKVDEEKKDPEPALEKAVDETITPVKTPEDTHTEGESLHPPEVTSENKSDPEKKDNKTEEQPSENSNNEEKVEKP